jgi:hypothetical protein
MVGAKALDAAYGFFIVFSLCTSPGRPMCETRMALHLARATALMVGKCWMRESSVTLLVLAR